MKTIRLILILATTVAAFGQNAQNKMGLTPAATYQEFLIALVKGDKAAVERLALPNKELAVLTSAPFTPPEHQKEAIGQIKATVYRQLRVGEVVTIPGGRPLGPTADMEKKGWVVIASDSDPLPHMLKKVGDDWKVDAGDLIAAWKALATQKK